MKYVLCLLLASCVSPCQKGSHREARNCHEQTIYTMQCAGYDSKMHCSFWVNLPITSEHCDYYCKADK